MTDRELAREWAKTLRDIPAHKWPDLVTAYALGLEHGRPTWTGTPPVVLTVPEWWWVRYSPSDDPETVCVFRSNDAVRVRRTGCVGDVLLAWLLTAQPACQWSSAPIPAPREPT